MEKGFTIPVLDHGYVRYIDHMGSDERIVEAARVSYKSASKGPEQDKKLLEYLYKNKHTSPFEMVKVTLNIKLPIFVMRQYVRHRMQNLNEMSARYTQLPEEFYIPERWRAQDPNNKQSSFEVAEPIMITDIDSSGFTTHDPTLILRQYCEQAYLLYEKFLQAGIAKEMARMVLPVNIYTECYATWDMKNLIHFITLRDDSHAQAEIQEYGKAIKQIVMELFPVTLGAFKRYKWVLVDTEAIAAAATLTPPQSATPSGSETISRSSTMIEDQQAESKPESNPAQPETTPGQSETAGKPEPTEATPPPASAPGETAGQ